MKNISSSTSSSNTSTPSTEDLPSKTAGFSWCSAFAMEAAFIVVGNLLAIVLFAANKKLRKISLFLVIHMAFAALLSRTLDLPFYIYLDGDDYQLWTTNAYKCKTLFISP